MKRPVCLWNETRGFRPRGRNPQTSSPDLSVHDRVESDQGVQRRSRSQRVVQVWRRVQIRKTRYGGALDREAGGTPALEGHLIQPSPPPPPLHLLPHPAAHPPHYTSSR